MANERFFRSFDSGHSPSVRMTSFKFVNLKTANWKPCYAHSAIKWRFRQPRCSHMFLAQQEKSYETYTGKTLRNEKCFQLAGRDRRCGHGPARIAQEVVGEGKGR